MRFPRIACRSVVLCVVLVGVSLADAVSEEVKQERTFAQRRGSFFTAVPADPFQAPRVTQIPLPKIRGGCAIWGATGRDDRGHIWIGVSTKGVPQPSAHLLEYAPETQRLVDRGDVIGQLRQLGILRPGEGQMKIHSRIVQADDGYLYFTSMDEEGEREDGSQLPTWGSHFWRLRPENPRWEHLLKIRHALIAVSCVGRYVYCLGYYGHPIVQYDTSTGKFRGGMVGAEGGHVSRNFLSDERGHSYAPRLAYAQVPDPNDARPNPPLHRELTSTLLELDTDLKIVAETPLEDYFRGSEDSHGILGVTHLADGSMVLVTHLGRLYRIVPRQNAPAKVLRLGWFHPQGSAYTTALFTLAGQRYLVGMAPRQGHRFDWLVYDLETDRSRSVPLVLDQIGQPPFKDFLLYGSISRDSDGAFYVAGRYSNASGNHPLLLRLELPAPADPTDQQAE